MIYAIRPFLNGEQFDQETIRILGVAFEQVCVALRAGDCDDVKQALVTRSSRLRKPATAILISYASALWKTFAETNWRNLREPLPRDRPLAAKAASNSNKSRKLGGRGHATQDADRGPSGWRMMRPSLQRLRRIALGGACVCEPE